MENKTSRSTSNSNSGDYCNEKLKKGQPPPRRLSFLRSSEDMVLKTLYILLKPMFWPVLGPRLLQLPGATK